jgi:hypothetical protein
MGIFEGTGATEVFEVKSLPHSPEGASFEVMCHQCGRAQKITLEWNQIAAAAMSPQTQRLPVDPVTRLPWQYDPQERRMWPQIGCIQCRTLVGPSISPDEAARILREGQMAGLVRVQ